MWVNVNVIVCKSVRVCVCEVDPCLFVASGML